MATLFAHRDPHSVLVWHQGRPVTRAGFAHAARQLAQRLPDTTHVINLCGSRLGFLLGFVAAGLRGQVTVLPHNQSPTALEAVRAAHPDNHLIDDACLQNLDWDSPADAAFVLDDDATAAILYTSGSTGAPQPQAKTWRTLLLTAELDAQRFLTQLSLTLLATVPSQHMFGLQTTVLLPLVGDCAVADARPFYPADVRAALTALPAPRALITTPTHLRACVASKITVPALDFVLCATAPLPLELAQRCETQWNTSVLEIYGSTEAGTIATRRVTQDASWQLLPGATLRAEDSGWSLHTAHLPQPLPLNDRIELLGTDRFELLGRDSEQLKIAGKRASLGDLTAALLRVPGVQDGVVFLPTGRERTAALAVAPGLDTAHILDCMGEAVDAVFLPRPLLLVDRLPRNEVGKLSSAALAQALTQGLSEALHGEQP